MIPPVALAALLALTAPTLPQQAPDARSAVAPSVAERALKLAETLNSEAIIIGDATSDAEAIELIQQVWGSRDELAQLEKENSGITLAFARELLPITNRSMRERLPELHQRQAALYASHFSATELDTLIAFYRSPTGAKLIATTMTSLKPKAIIAEASQSEDFKFSAQAALKDVRATVPDTLKVMDATDKAVLMRFAQSGVAPKMRALAPKTQQLAIDWMNEEAPWEGAEIEKALERVFARFRQGKTE
jgi:hypothetical protein